MTCPLELLGSFLPQPMPPPFCNEPSPCECEDIPFHECYCDDDGDGLPNFWEDDDCDGVPNLVDGSTAAGGCYLLGAACLAIDPTTGRARYELACSACYRRPAVDPRIDSNNDGVINCEDDEVEDGAPGRIVMFNHDDDNNDGLLDFLSDGPLEDAEGVPVEDDELVEIRVRAPGDVESWSIVFPDYVEGTIIPVFRVYRKSDRTEEVASGEVYDDAPPGTFHIEGGKRSAVQSDMQITFTATWKSGVDANGEDEFCELSDAVTLTVALVRFTDIRGLFNERGEYNEGYAGQDDVGRVYSNRVYNQDDPSETIWTKNRQYLDVFVEVLPDDLVLPAGARIEWAWTDPDDPSDAPPTHASAAAHLDPNDHDGEDADGDGLDKDGMDNTGERDDRSVWEQIDENHVIEGQNRTAIAGLRSSIRFDVTDDGGDNFVVRPGLVLPDAGGGRAEVQSGIMTTWKLIHLETVKMPSGQPLPYNDLNQHFEMAFVEWRAEEPRAVPDQNPMGANENAAYLAVGEYVKAPPIGQFTREGQGGWFFMASAGDFAPDSEEQSEAIIDYKISGNSRVLAGEGANGWNQLAGILELPADIPPQMEVSAVEIANEDESKHVVFGALKDENEPLRQIKLIAPNYHPFEDNPNSKEYMGLEDHGFGLNEMIQATVYSPGALYTAGISPATWENGNYYFQGRTIVFDGGSLRTMIHELIHGLGMAHICGKRDFLNMNDCAMHYGHLWLRAPDGGLIPWSAGNAGDNICVPHLKYIRTANLESDKTPPGWRILQW